jgi:AbiV family abortive infection protein
VDLKAVKAASAPALLACVAAAAENADGLLGDAERLAGAGQYARAYSLSALAVEEFGKAASLLTLANMPRDVRGQAPVGRMLEWHQLKLVGGMLMAVLGFGPPGMAARFAAMPISRLEQILDATNAFADDADALKRRGLYVDMDGHGRIRRPSEITEAEVCRQLAQARQVAASASLLRDPGVQSRFADPPAEAVELSRALVLAFAEAGNVRTPRAAAAVALNAVRKLQDHMADPESDKPLALERSRHYPGNERSGDGLGAQDSQNSSVRSRVEHDRLGTQLPDGSDVARIWRAPVADQRGRLEAGRPAGHGHRHRQVEGRQLERRQCDRGGSIGPSGLVTNGSALGGGDPRPSRAGQRDDLDVLRAGIVRP